YWNGPDTTNSNGRGIYIQNIEFVPAPGAVALAGAGLLVGLRRRRTP
ncbi:MAG: PEP-CTERM sorting domain-containing protein, partial [Phycisphaeraceae bacterium]